MKKKARLKTALLLMLLCVIMTGCATDDLPSPILPEEEVGQTTEASEDSVILEDSSGNHGDEKGQEDSSGNRDDEKVQEDSGNTKVSSEDNTSFGSEVNITGEAINKTEEKQPFYSPGTYDSADTAVLTRVDTKNKTITFRNLEINKNYTLNYDGTSCFYDSYGQGLSAAQLQIGSIVDITFLHKIKRLTTLQYSEVSWSFTDTGEYRFKDAKQEILIGENTYKIDRDVLFFSQENRITQMDINPVDRLSFYGINNTIFSIVVSSGHGYLRLVGQENFVDGWIEIGTSVIKKVTEEMLIAVPEGKYEVKLSNNGNTLLETVSIKQNQETKLDVSYFVPEEAKTGTVIFSITPSNATLHIDGEEVDYSKAVELTYGLHQLICRANGYKTITQYLSVGQASAGVDITLEEGESDTNTSEGSDSDAVSTSYYKVYIDSPENVEVYLDGTYVGVSPCSFKKVEGSHVITLSKEGYVTRSYTVTISDETKDETYSFDKLVSTNGEAGNSQENGNTSGTSSSSEEGNIGTAEGTGVTEGTGSGTGTGSGSTDSGTGTGSGSTGSGTGTGSGSTGSGSGTGSGSTDSGTGTGSGSTDSGTGTGSGSTDSGTGTGSGSTGSGTGTGSGSTDSGSGTGSGSTGSGTGTGSGSTGSGTGTGSADDNETGKSETPSTPTESGEVL